MAAPMAVKMLLTGHILLLSIGTLASSEEPTNLFEQDESHNDTTGDHSQLNETMPDNGSHPMHKVHLNFEDGLLHLENETQMKDESDVPGIGQSARVSFIEAATGTAPGSDTCDINQQTDSQINAPSVKITCLPRNRTENETLMVQLVNSTSLLQTLGNKNDSVGHCTVVLFYAPWCVFCARVAPDYNALARAFPQLDILAIDAIHFSSLNTRYGTIAVPNVLVFYNNSKAVAKFNHTERTFENFVAFVSNVTGFRPNASVTVMPFDYEGPLQNHLSEERDWLLWLSWTFVVCCCSTVFSKSQLGKNLWNTIANFGMEHHQHIE